MKDRKDELPFEWMETLALEDHPGEGQPAGDVPAPGGLCPQCARGRLDYDGLLNLACPRCGYVVAGCFT